MRRTWHLRRNALVRVVCLLVLDKRVRLLHTLVRFALMTDHINAVKVLCQKELVASVESKSVIVIVYFAHMKRCIVM